MDVINPHRFSTAAPAVDFDGFGNASRYFNGVSDYIDLGDSDDFSFGDGSNDSAFSCAAWIKMEDHLKFRIISKYNNKTPYNKEWTLSSDSIGRLMFLLDDKSAGGRIERRYSDITTFASYVGQWIHVVGTYDGGGTDSGIKLYINGSRVDDVSLSSGSYTAMENTPEPCKIGTLITSAGQDYTQGYIADCRLYSSELSSTDIAAIYGGENITTNLIGHWLKDTPSLLDHSGTNDGTNNGSAFAYDNPSPAVEFGKASRSFDGVNDYVDLGDSDDFSFGDSVNDSPFSVCAWVKMTDATLFRIACKQNNTATGAEWLLSTGGNDKMYWALYDESTSVYRGLISDTTFTSYQGQWVHVAATYDGTGGASAQTGMIIYLTPEGGTTTTLTTTDFTAGTYTAMHNTVAPVRIGEFNNTYSDGSMTDMRLYDKELSSAEIQSIANGTHVETNLVGHWLTNTDDVKDYAGVNDGTNNGSTYSFDNPLGEGEFGSASRSFDGSSSYIELANIVSIGTGSMSWSAWAKAPNTSTGTYPDTIGRVGDNGGAAGGNSRYDGLHLLFYQNKLTIYFADFANYGGAFIYQTSYTYNVNQWYHLCGVLNASTQKLELYVDGVLDGSVDVSAAYPWNLTATRPPSIGARKIGTNYNNYFNGNIADVRLYDDALFSTDILNLSRGYDYRTNLVGQWLTNKDDVDDYAGTNHGTNNGSTYSQNAPL